MQKIFFKNVKISNLKWFSSLHLKNEPNKPLIVTKFPG
jgi:hypothetical protein